MWGAQTVIIFQISCLFIPAPCQVFCVFNAFALVWDISSLVARWHSLCCCLATVALPLYAQPPGTGYLASHSTFNFFKACLHLSCLQLCEVGSQALSRHLLQRRTMGPEKLNSAFNGHTVFPCQPTLLSLLEWSYVGTWVLEQNQQDTVGSWDNCVTAHSVMRAEGCRSTNTLRESLCVSLWILSPSFES